MELYHNIGSFLLPASTQDLANNWRLVAGLGFAPAIFTLIIALTSNEGRSIIISVITGVGCVAIVIYLTLSLFLPLVHRGYSPTP